MILSARFQLALLFLLVPAASLHGQNIQERDPLTPFVPRQPETRRELDRLEALKLYAVGLLHERNNHLIEAVRAFERALQLDPQGAPLYKALVSLYLALDRGEDALTACRKVLELDPGDFDSWQLLARQLRAQHQPRDAADALTKAIACPGLKDRPDVQAHLYYDLGTLYESIQDLARAESALRQAATLLDNPQHIVEHSAFTREEVDLQAAETYERLGRVCLKSRRPDEAIAAFRQAQKRDPARATHLSYNLAEVYLSQGKRGEALQCLDSYLETQPQSVEGYEVKIKVLHELNRGAEVVPALRRYSTRDRHHLGLRLLLAREYHLAGQSDLAETEYEGLLKESPTSEAYRGLFEMYKKMGKPGWEKLLERLNTSLKQVDPDKPDNDAAAPAGSAAEAARARAMLTVLRGDPELVKALLPLVVNRLLVPDGLARPARFYFAVLAARARQLDAAERLYRSCLPRVEGAAQASEHLVYGGLLEVLWQAHKYEAVVEVCQQGLERTQATNRTMFHFDMARALAQLGKMNTALEQATAAVDVAQDGHKQRCRRLRARLLAEAGRREQALAECDVMVREAKSPGDLRESRYTLSTVHSHFKNFPKAEEQLQLILQSDPSDATACNDLGYIWADQGKHLEEAEKSIRKALELDRKQRNSGTSVDADSDQDNPAYVDSLGWVLFRRGRHSEARQELERASQMHGGADDPVVWDHLGDVYYRLNERARAHSAWKKALELYEKTRTRQPDDRYKEIQQKLKTLKP